MLIEQVFSAIKLADFIVRMNVSKDEETSRLTFHMAKLFSKFPQMHQLIIASKSDIIPAIMQCLKDKDLPAFKKREAL